MIKAGPWIDEILKGRKFYVKLSRKTQKTFLVEFNQLPDETDGKKDLETNQKNFLRINEAEKIYKILKKIFADNLASNCIDQLMKLEYCELNAETSETTIEKDLYDEYKSQMDKFFIIFMDCMLQLLSKKMSMISDTVDEISRLCNKIVQSKKYFVFSQPVTNIIIKNYNWSFHTYSAYIYYIHAIQSLNDSKSDISDTDIKTGILYILNAPLTRNNFVCVCPDINWKEVPEYLHPDAPETKNVVNRIYTMLERDANRIMENNPSATNEDILLKKLNDLFAFYNEVYKTRLEKDKEFANFEKSFRAAETILNKSLENARIKHYDRIIEEAQETVPDDFMTIQELDFLKKIYSLIYNQRLPSNDFQWHDVDEKIIDRICTYVEELADYNSIYRYVYANYATLWNVIDDIHNRLRYPVAYHINQLIERMNLGMETYHAIYQKLCSNNMEKSDLIDFENRLAKVYSYFRTNLWEVYDSVLEDSTAEFDLEKILLERDSTDPENE